MPSNNVYFLACILVSSKGRIGTSTRPRASVPTAAIGAKDDLMIAPDTICPVVRFLNADATLHNTRVRVLIVKANKQTFQNPAPVVLATGITTAS